jgi:tetratricopeptide (TPR) repeat protein
MEQKKIMLSQIGLYNPQRLNDEQVEGLFIARQKIFQFLIEKLNKETPKSIPQHYLIIAQRGMGKTTLLKRIEVALRSVDNKKNFIPLLFPEEQYNLKNGAEFWLNSLDALADTLEFENEKELAKRIDEKVIELLKIKDQEDLAKEAFQFLKSFTLSIKRRPVLLVDNMSIIFNRLVDKSEQHKLRAWLMQNGAPIIIGASAVAMEDVSDYNAPFYDAFQIHYLKKLSFTELINILNNLAKLTHSEEVMLNIQQKIARLRTIHQLTGGNPRTGVMLFKLIVKGFAEEINDDLEALLDEITPLYKARFEELSTQMQVIVDAIALHWDPINLEQLRNATRYENGQLSPQLKRLIEIGWIERIDAYEAKGNAYQISERFFNIWFLMRRSSRRQKKELYCLSKFLESFYGDELDGLANHRLSIQSKSLDHVTYDLAMALVVKDKSLKEKLQEKCYTVLRELAKANPEILKQFDIPEDISLHTRIIKYYIDSIINNKDLFERNDINLLRKLGLEPNQQSGFYHVLGHSYEKFEDYQNAEKYLAKALESDKILENFVCLGKLYLNKLEKIQDAERIFLQALEHYPEDVESMQELGFLYRDKLNDYNKSKQYLEKSLDFSSTNAHVYHTLGHLYSENFSNYIKAEEYFIKSLELDKSNRKYLNCLAYLQINELKKYNEAEKSLLKYLQLEPNSPNHWNSLGNLYQDYLKQYLDAEDAYKHSISIDDNNWAKYNLVFLYRDKMNKSQEAKALFNELEIEDRLEDSYHLNKSLFELYEKNRGLAKDYLLKALAKIESELPDHTQDDWWRFGAVVTKLNYGNWLCAVLEETENNIKLAPYYVAIKAMSVKNREGYLNSKSVELREPAKKLIEIMSNY